MFEEIIVMIAQPTPKARKHITARVAKRQCLCCDRPALKRGLCYQCYYKWKSNRSKLPTAAKRAAFDSRLIRIGRLLAAQAVRAYRNGNVFARTMDEVS